MANFYLTTRKNKCDVMGIWYLSDLSNLTKTPILCQENGYNMLLLAYYEKEVTDLSLHFAALEKHCAGKHPCCWSRQNNKTPTLVPSSLQLYFLLCGALTKADVLKLSTPTHFSASACHCICYHTKKTRQSNSSSQDAYDGCYLCMLLHSFSKNLLPARSR